MRRLWLGVALLGFPLGALAADNPWVGTWKLDAAKSHFTGDTFTYSKGPNGLIHYSDGSTTQYDFGTDGKEYKTWAGRMTTWTAAGPTTWNTVTKQDGAVVYQTRRELSADGKTLTLTTTSNKPDGSPVGEVAVYERVGKGKGLLGKWRSTKTDIASPSAMVITAPSAGVLRLEYPGWKAVYEAKLDGSEFKPTGPTIPANFTGSMKSASATKVNYVYRLNGKPDGYGVMTVSADGKTLTDVSWNPGKESEKSTGYYVKQ